MQFSPQGGNGTVLAPSDVVAVSANFEDTAKNQIEAQRSGFDLERRSKGAQTKNPAALKELPDFERSGLRSDVVESGGLEPSTFRV